MKHVPGPYRVEPSHRPGNLQIVSSVGGTVAEVFSGPNTARLFAGAPELLDELQEAANECCRLGCYYGRHTESCRERRALIRRIEGEG